MVGAGRDRGAGMRAPAVILLNGQPGDRSDWDAIVARLPGSVRVFAWDRPGYGGNRSPASTLEGNAIWLLDRWDAAVLVGHSYGGGVALVAAAMAPERVRGLALLASIGPGCVTVWDELLAAPVAGPMPSMTAWTVLPWMARQCRGLLVRGRAAGPPSLQALACIRHDHGRVRRSFLTEQRELLRGLDRWLGRLGGAPMPTLILADPMDKVVSISTARAVHDRFLPARAGRCGRASSAAKDSRCGCSEIG
ncbi:alpha/beta fold hydrolase [Nocardia terpenica]|uniref:AB hydrolase-1 domain-containing protein n=1 Tax=Nocardia terpenica TaxID=455432 RepID=A0A164MKB5_9NOCA|nr:alpha/beta hydrolase [Nocardia terpenica]KZM73434.1 hypothetical protein AWN90_32890 [Nocardia terpenica]NQE87388.1 alpha/beta hydrolase [Nocardia terpenica]